MVYANSYVYNYMADYVDEVLEQGRYIDMMNTICLGCGDEMFANVLICEVCWNGD